MLVYILIRIFPVLALGPFMLGHFKASVITSYSQVQSALMCLKILLPQKYKSFNFSTFDNISIRITILLRQCMLHSSIGEVVEG